MSDTTFPVVQRPCHRVNFRKGRDWSGPPDMVTIHVTEGSAASVRSWFNTPAAQVSAHYLVTREGAVEQFVGEGDTAFHNGRVLRPTAALVLERPGVNPNRYSVGIEHEGTGRDDLTAPQRAASLWLVRDVCLRHGIPIDRRHVVGHREVYAAKTCPGAIDVDRYVRELAATVPAAARPTIGDRPPKPELVWSDYGRAWLLVTRVVSDDEWYYVPVSVIPGVLAGAGGQQVRAETPLSQMPR